MSLRPERISDELHDLLSMYADDLRDSMAGIVDKASTECLKELRTNSPERTGAYKHSWVRSKTKRGTVIHNKKYRITHLLEDGHANRDGSRTGGIPHIGPAAEHSSEMMLRLTKKVISE